METAFDEYFSKLLCRVKSLLSMLHTHTHTHTHKTALTAPVSCVTNFVFYTLPDCNNDSADKYSALFYFVLLLSLVQLRNIFTFKTNLRVT
jgi:hypothetical protein